MIIIIGSYVFVNGPILVDILGVEKLARGSLCNNHLQVWAEVVMLGTIM